MGGSVRVALRRSYDDVVARALAEKVRGFGLGLGEDGLEGGGGIGGLR